MNDQFNAVTASFADSILGPEERHLGLIHYQTSLLSNAMDYFSLILHLLQAGGIIILVDDI